MRNSTLSPRLAALLDCAEKCRTLADIGTDHAFLPIEAVRAGLCERAIACDISAGPLDIAKKNIHAAGLSEKIETRLGDGLQPILPDEADCVVIAGMGGMKIMEILENAHEKIQNARLILQAQHDLEELRRFLHANMYIINEEILSRERGRFYVVLKVRGAHDQFRGHVSEATHSLEAGYTDAEYFLGKIKSPHVRDFHRARLEKIEAYFPALRDENERATAEKRIKWLEEVLL